MGNPRLINAKEFQKKKKKKKLCLVSTHLLLISVLPLCSHRCMIAVIVCPTTVLSNRPQRSKINRSVKLAPEGFNV